MRRVRIWCWVTALVLVATGCVVVYLTPSLRYNQVAFDREEAERRTEEVRERAEAIREQQEKERAERKLPKEYARQLTEEAEAKEREEMIRHIREVQRIEENLSRENEVRREKLKEINPKDRLNQQLEPVRKNLDRTFEAIEKIRNYKDEPAPPDFHQDLDEKEEKLRELQEQLEDGFDREALAELAKESRELTEMAESVDPGENRGYDSSRRELIWSSRDTAGEAEKLLESTKDLEIGDLTDSLEASALQRDPLPENVVETLENPENRSTAELHEAAQELENRLNQALDESRAIELAARQGSDLEAAREKLLPSEARMTEIPSLSTPELPGTVQELNERREAIGEAARQVSQLGQRANEASRQFLNNDSDRPSVISLSNSLDPSLQASLNQAAQSQSGQVNDVSGLMRMALGQSGGAGTDGGDDQMRNLEGSQRQSAAGSGKSINLRGSDVTANALPGRRFSESSAREGWLYLDTWYVIGPWDNYGDLHSFDTPHPPESEINFDGIYSGKIYSTSHANRDYRQGIDRGYSVGEPRKLEWRFIQSDSIRIDMPDEVSDATYYLYTDVYFEDGRDMLLAIGSDDAAKVWINGIVVWMDKNLSSWRLGENFSKVYFKKGYNSILVRLENGPGQCEISVLICPPSI